MPRLSRIYTRTGDDGTTGLGDGSRTPKDSPRVETIGDLDELNSVVGLVIERAQTVDLGTTVHFLRWCQHRIFDLGGEISIPGHTIVNDTHVTAVETELDRINAELPPLANFILPGGSELIATIHIARSTCRRAERRIVALTRSSKDHRAGLGFINRLSDYLFVLGRYVAAQTGVDEVLWEQDSGP